MIKYMDTLSKYNLPMPAEFQKKYDDITKVAWITHFTGLILYAVDTHKNKGTLRTTVLKYLADHSLYFSESDLDATMQTKIVAIKKMAAS